MKSPYNRRKKGSKEKTNTFMNPVELDRKMYDICSVDFPELKFPIRCIVDMETGDPDDYFALIMLLCSKKTDVVAVTINPGTEEQVGLVKAILRDVEQPVPVGSRKPLYDKNCMGGKFWRSLPYKWKKEKPDGFGHEVIYNAIKKNGKNLVICTCGPLSNVGEAFQKNPDLEVEMLLSQGGFAGDNCVLPENRMKKFEGKISCPTWNFGGDTKAANYLLQTKQISRKVCVSKNVCHSVVYDKKFHRKMLRATIKNEQNLCLKKVHEGMEIYFRNPRKKEKKFHDPLAMLCLLYPGICEFRSVKISRTLRPNGWKSELKEGSDTMISVAVDHSKFQEALLNIV